MIDCNKVSNSVKTLAPNTIDQCICNDKFEFDSSSKKCICIKGYKFDTTSLTCNTICGDGYKTASEECDDGNNYEFDGCSMHCKITNPLPVSSGLAIGGGVLGGVALVALGVAALKYRGNV